MKIEQRSENSFRVRKKYKGKTYTVNFDHKPSQKEVVKAMAEALDQEQTKKEKRTFEDCALEYISSRDSVISPSTIRSYYSYLKCMDGFKEIRMKDMTATDVQSFINRMSAEGKSPKTCRNYHGFISPILGVYRPDMHLNTQLPMKRKTEPYIPNDEEVEKLISVLKTRFKGKYFVAAVLGAFGLRRSEIAAITASDVKGDILTINKAKVRNSAGEWVIKSTKTTKSERSIVIPMDIANMIVEKGCAYSGTPHSISTAIGTVERELGMEHFSLHKLRHYYASKMDSLGYAESDILESGGWSSPYVMKAVYRHSMMMKNEKQKRDAASKLGDAFL